MTDLHPNARAVAAALAERGATGTVRVLADSARTAADAAAALDCPVGAIANSLVFMADGRPLLVLTSGAHRVDTTHLAGQIGAGAIERASAEQVRAATGQPIGGVAPVGHPAPVRTVIDEALAGYDRIWAAAGTPHTVFPTTFEELMRVCNASPVTVRP